MNVQRLLRSGENGAAMVRVAQMELPIHCLTVGFKERSINYINGV
jgi:hypothetical protein